MTRAAPPSTSAMARLAFTENALQVSRPAMQGKVHGDHQEAAAVVIVLQILQSVHDARKTIRGGFMRISSAAPAAIAGKFPGIGGELAVTFEAQGDAGALRAMMACALGRQGQAARFAPFARAVPAPGLPLPHRS